MKYLSLATSACALLAFSFSPAQAEENDFVTALKSGKPYAEARFLYETVDQDNISRAADASTLRTVLGYKTGVFEGFQADLGVFNISHLGPEHFDDGRNGHTLYPKVTDPRTTELYMANIAYTGVPDTTVIVGRQKIALDNQRWVGAPSWRQVPQTFDAATVENKSIKDLALFYGYVREQNRPASAQVANGAYHMDTHLFHAAYSGVRHLRLSGFSYLADIDNSDTQSSITSGLRAEGEYPLNGDVTLTANAEYARQSDYGDNPGDYGLNYYLFEPGVDIGGFSFGGGYELSEGDGTHAVQSPMKSAHGFNGWADMFSATPAGGLRDAYLTAAYSFRPPVEYLDKAKIQFQAHNFHGDSAGGHYGNEYDLDLTQNFARNFAATVQYADYRADTFSTDTKKLSFVLQFKY